MKTWNITFLDERPDEQYDADTMARYGLGAQFFNDGMIVKQFWQNQIASVIADVLPTTGEYTYVAVRVDGKPDIVFKSDADNLVDAACMTGHLTIMDENGDLQVYLVDKLCDSFERTDTA